MEPPGKDVICHRCNYHWVYKGKNKHVAHCPDCKTCVTLTRSDARLKEKLEAERMVIVTASQNRSR